MMVGGTTAIGLRPVTERAGWRARCGRFSLFVAGLVLGGSLSLVSGEQASKARLSAWLGAAPTKDADRLAATAGPAETPGLGSACTALVLDRFTGLTAALACAETPAMQPPLALRRGEIES